MPALTPRARQLVQLLAEELDLFGGPWSALLEGDGARGYIAWNWRIELEGRGEVDWYESNPETNQADVIPINRLR